MSKPKTIRAEGRTRVLIGATRLPMAPGVRVHRNDVMRYNRRTEKAAVRREEHAS